MRPVEHSTVWMALADASKVWRLFRTAGTDMVEGWFWARLMYQVHVWAWHGQSQSLLAQQQQAALTQALLRLQALSQTGNTSP